MDRLIKHWKGVLSLGLSVAVIWVFIQDANTQDLQALLLNLNWTWLAAALIIKSISLTIHEYRLWLGFGQPRPPIQKTMQIGFASALLNMLFPGRAGDIAAIAMLHKNCNVPVGTATFAVGMVGFFEGAIFGLMMILVLLLNAPMWIQFLGEETHLQSLQTISGVTLLGIVIVVVAAVVGRRFTEAPPEEQDGFSPLTWIQDTFRQTQNNLTSVKYILLNSLASVAEVWLMIASFAMGFEMLGLESSMIDLSPLLTWSLSGLVLGLSAVASIVFPQTYGAGSAAASVLILGFFGFDQTQALGFASIWWLISQVPTLVLGLPSLWMIGRKSSDQIDY